MRDLASDGRKLVPWERGGGKLYCEANNKVSEIEVRGSLVRKAEGATAS